jgi:hypothetical protein
MAARSYIADLPGGTATTTIQITGRQTLKKATFAFINAAAGKIELSTVSAAQIGTAQPTADVIARLSVGSSGQSVLQMDINMPVDPFQNVYVHQTGAGNLGSVTLS